MASTIKVDNVQNQPGTNIINKCSTTITIGASSDTVTLACGASQTGFGRTGTVDWDTSIKTGTVTAVSGSGYFVNTTSGGITVNLPAAAVGSIVAVSDYASTSDSNSITITPNGSEKINGVNNDYTLNTAGLAVTLVYADATRGWKSVTGSDADATGVVPTFVVATGGTPCSGAIVCTDYKVHTFTGPGTLCVSAVGNPAGSNTVDYLVVAGGGGGAMQHAGGGGAGGYLTTFTPSPAGLPVTATGYPIGVGGGGAGGGPGVPGVSGTPSTFSTITSTAGGGGGGWSGSANAGLAGGSGGGGSATCCGSGQPGGAGNTPATPVSQGNPGGLGFSHATSGGGGGGGGAAAGADALTVAHSAGAGGAGAQNNIDGNNHYWAGGGGGGNHYCTTPTVTGLYAGPGGIGGGGGGGTTNPGGPAAAGGGSAINDGAAGGAGGGVSGTGGAGGTNSGGGGGSSGAATVTAGTGGSGVVVIRYKFQ